MASALAWAGDAPEPRRQDELGASRQLCIGDEADCAKRIVGALKSRGGLDLTITFEYDSAVLTEPARANLDQFAAALKRSGLTSPPLDVDGHTDAKGRDDYNLDLSTRRAKAVVTYLQAHGVDTAQVRAKGWGRQRPISDDPFSSANRRVEARLRPE